MRIKMVVTDLDGTLLRKDKSVSEHTINTINNLRDEGIIFAIATARPPRTIFNVVPFSLKNTYVISLNGAEIYYDHKKIMERYITAEEVKGIISKIRKNFSYAKISFEINDKLYANFDLSKIANIPYKDVNLDDFNYSSVAKILVKIDDFDMIDFFEKLKGYTVDITDRKTFVQLVHKESGKFNGIKYVAKLIDVDIREVVAFGDDTNDLKMIMGCGIGVAMENGDESVKKAADIIAPSNEEDGVAVVLKQIRMKKHE